MNRVICDVCGSRYPETAEQCPICGCAKPENARIVSGDVSAKETKSTGSYTYVKGGRFSKGNVRKRNKAASAVREEKSVSEPHNPTAESGNNKGLVIAIVALLLAIVAVMLFIFLRYFNPWNSGSDDTLPVQTTTAEATTLPTETEPATYPCIGIELSSDTVSLDAIGDSWLLNVQLTPDNTTDALRYSSSDDTIATVNSEGRITAMAAGEAIITVSCGDLSAECAVTVTDASVTTEETVPETTESTANVSGDWKMNRNDISFSKSGDSWNLFKGSIPADVITWTSEDETIATIENGIVTAVGPGITNVHGELDGTKYSCIIRCRFTAASESGTDDSTQATETTAPEQTDTKYILRINGQNVEKRPFGNDVTIKIGERFELTLTTDNGDVIAISWTASKEGVCTINGNTIIGSKKGRTEITVNYYGKDYTCVVNVQ